MSEPGAPPEAPGDEMPPKMPEPVDPDAPGLGPLIMGITWTMTILCIPIIVARFYDRARVVRNVSVDDWLMLVAVALQLVFQGIVTHGYTFGLGKRDQNLTVPQIVEIMKWMFVSTTPAILVSVVARISATILLIRIFGTKVWLKWFLIVFTVLQTAVAVALIVIVWVQIDPIAGLWDPSVEARRWDFRIQLYTAYLTQSLFSFADLTYVLFPIMVIWKLNMPLRRKIGLAVLMGLSLITMAASIMKAITAQPPADDAEDVQQDASMAILWSGLEQTLVIIMGSVPPLRAKSKLAAFSKLRSFGSSIVNLVSGSGTRATATGNDSSNSRSNATRYTFGGSGRFFSMKGDENGGYDNLDGNSTKDQATGDGSELSCIRRTDQYTVSYSRDWASRGHRGI